MRTVQEENLNFHFPAQIQARHKRRQMVNQHQRTIVKKVGQRKSSIKNPICSQYHIIQVILYIYITSTSTYPEKRTKQ